MDHEKYHDKDHEKGHGKAHEKGHGKDHDKGHDKDDDKRRMATASGRGGRKAAAAMAAGATAAAVTLTSVVSLGRAQAATTHRVEIEVVKTLHFGRVLAAGTTLYTLKPSSTPCAAKCDSVWPPVVLPRGQMHPGAGHGVVASRLGTKRVASIGLQVTYGGKLLYRYVGDTASGQVNGNFADRWGKWSPLVVSKSSSASGSKPGSTSGSGSAPSSNAGTGGVSF